ncbi:hypothetical protein M0805_004390 [Coniferiporia weirii]|nr:hypothetical protein M0805_004390 [Coniferiporia weirii]
MDTSVTPRRAPTRSSSHSALSYHSPTPGGESRHSALSSPSPIDSYHGDHAETFDATIPFVPYTLPALYSHALPNSQSQEDFISHAEQVFQATLPALFCPLDSDQWAQAAHDSILTIHQAIPSGFEPPTFSARHDLLRTLHNLVGALDPTNLFEGLSHFCPSHPSSPDPFRSDPVPYAPAPSASAAPNIQDMLHRLEVNLMAQSGAHLSALQDLLTNRIQRLEDRVLPPARGPPAPAPPGPLSTPCNRGPRGLHPLAGRPPPFSRRTLQERNRAAREAAASSTAADRASSTALTPADLLPPQPPAPALPALPRPPPPTVLPSGPPDPAPPPPPCARSALRTRAPGPPPGLLAPAPNPLPAAPVLAPTPSPATAHTSAALLRPDFIRFVARFYDQPIPSDTRPPSKTIIDRVHRALDAIPTSQHVRLVGAEWNPSGNLIFSFPTSLSVRSITAVLPVLRAALRVPLTHPLTISQDVKWAKVILGRVITRDSPAHPLFTDAQLLDGLSVNPHFLTLHLTQLPRWLRQPESISSDRSSITFAFEDPDGSLLQQFCARPLFLFGQSARPTPFADKPRFSQCTKCWKLGHLTASCQNRPTCRACNHFHCANCNGAHPSDSLDCPKRAQYYNCPSAAGPTCIGMASPPPALGRAPQLPSDTAPPPPRPASPDAAAPADSLMAES